ncbi:MAG TPA: right-handed parallel beta-helix repeat-containing protein, partial [Planctomycetota bacterium]|nr:right-handed parallel beta-helix repeat-containing protein [Planctomycetota bacterium]
MVLLLGLVCGGQLFAAQLAGRPGDDVVDLIKTMKPGDELILAAGTYKSTKYNEIKGMHGTKDAWFTIRGVSSGSVVIQNAIKENTFNITDCSYFRFYDLEITGRIGGPAFKWMGDCTDMIVENCYMHDMGGQGISCSSIKSMARMRVSHCHISFTGANGEGFYLAHQDGSAPLTDSLFECNLVHDMGGTRGSGFQGDGFDVNPGCTGNTIRYNAIYRTQCPGIVVENEKDGAPNTIEGNMSWDCLDDADIQVNANAIVKDNVVRGGKRQLVLGNKNVQASNNTVLDAATVS